MSLYLWNICIVVFADWVSVHIFVQAHYPIFFQDLKKKSITFPGLLMYFGYSMMHSVKERKQKELELYQEHIKQKDANMISGDMTQTAPDYTNVSNTAAAPVGYTGHGNGYSHPGGPAYNGTGAAPGQIAQPGVNPNNPFQQQGASRAQPGSGDGGYGGAIGGGFTAQNDPYADRGDYGYQGDEYKPPGPSAGVSGASVEQPRQRVDDPAPVQAPSYAAPQRDEWGRKIPAGRGGGGYYQ